MGIEEDQLQPEDTLVDRGVEDILDEGMSPPEKLRGANAKGVTPQEEIEGETIDERLRQENPDPWQEAGTEVSQDDIVDGPVRGEVGEDRAGRLVSPDEGVLPDDESELIGEDEGIDGGAASAEEAAVHVFDEADDGQG